MFVCTFFFLMLFRYFVRFATYLSSPHFCPSRSTILTTPSVLEMIVTVIFGVTIEHTNLMTKSIQFSS